MKFSVIIPARNEEKYIGSCLESIEKAAIPFPSQVEVIVVLNRCTDLTEEIARAKGARVVYNDSKNLSKIRNSGVKEAKGDILVTIDADSIVSKNMLTEINKALETGKYIGGGVPVRPERMSLGINISYALLRLSLLFTRLSGGLFWCYLKDFQAVGGFNEDMTFGEDLDFAIRLKAYGKRYGKRFGLLKKTYIVTSCRKFDRFGDWFFLKLLIFQSRHIKEGLRGDNNKFADKYFYDFER